MLLQLLLLLLHRLLRGSSELRKQLCFCISLVFRV